MSTATLIGLLAGSLTTAAWLPQVARAFRTRSTRDFSWGWFAMFGTGVGIWLLYGFAAGAPAVIVTNALTFLLVLGLGLLKLAHAGRPHGTAPRRDSRGLALRGTDVTESK